MTFSPAIQYKPSSYYEIYYNAPKGYVYYPEGGGYYRLCPPYGVTKLGFNAIRAGTGQTCLSDGTKLWG